MFAIKPLATHWNFVTEKILPTQQPWYHFLYMNLGKVCMSVKRQWVAMFVSWRFKISVRKRKDPITCNLFIDVSQHVDRVLLYISADIRLLCWLLVSVDTPSTDALSTRYRLLLTTYPVRKFGAWQSLKTALFGADYHS